MDISPLTMKSLDSWQGFMRQKSYDSIELSQSETPTVGIGGFITFLFLFHVPKLFVYTTGTALCLELQLVINVSAKATKL